MKRVIQIQLTEAQFTVLAHMIAAYSYIRLGLAVEAAKITLLAARLPNAECAILNKVTLLMKAERIAEADDASPTG